MFCGHEVGPNLTNFNCTISQFLYFKEYAKYWKLLCFYATQEMPPLKFKIGSIQNVSNTSFLKEHSNCGCIWEVSDKYL